MCSKSCNIDPGILEAAGSSQTEVFRPECPQHVTKSRHDLLYCQTSRNGQIFSAACRQPINGSGTRQTKEDADASRSYSRQQFTEETLTQPGEVKTRQPSYTGTKPHYACGWCDKAFGFLSDLWRHEIIHTGDKPFCCQVCGKGFSQLISLNRHLLIHTGEKPFVCNWCDKSFTALSYLRRHKRTHTGEKPFVCKWCGKNFSNSSNLRTHKRIHTGERPFVCKWCNKNFSDSSNLRTHKRIHTGERPFTPRTSHI